MALAVLVVLGIVVATFSADMSVSMTAQRNRLEQDRAKRMAESGFQLALATLVDQDVNITASTDPWTTLGESGEMNYVVGERGSFRIQILDAGAFLNVNSVTQEQWERMGVEPDIIDAILDWREEGFQPRPQGAKDEYYNTLPQPYNTKLRPFDLVDELLLVRGVTPSLLYRPIENTTAPALTSGDVATQPALYELLTADSEAPNTRQDGSAKINANSATVQQLTQAGVSQTAAQAVVTQRNTVGTFTSLNQVFQTPGLTPTDAEALLNVLTTTNETIVTGKLNLNSVTEPVLRTFPDLTEDVISAIISRQGTFANLGELATVSGMTVQTLATMADAFTVGSRAFLVRVMGRYANSTVALEGVIVIEDNLPRLKRIQPTPFVDTLTKWNWSDETTSETVLLEAA